MLDDSLERNPLPGAVEADDEVRISPKLPLSETMEALANTAVSLTPEPVPELPVEQPEYTWPVETPTAPVETNNLTSAEDILNKILRGKWREVHTMAELESIGQFTPDQIRRAYLTIAQDIFKRNADRKAQIPGVMHKIEGERDMIMIMSAANPADLTFNAPPIYTKISLAVSIGDNPPVRFTLPLTEITDRADLVASGFVDLRVGEHASYYDLSEYPNDENLSRVLLGMRWMAANLIHWEEKDVILPEELD